MRIASFNVENLFARPRALNQTTWAQGQPILQAYKEFNALIAKAVYTASDKARLIDLLVKVDVYRRSSGARAGGLRRCLRAGSERRGSGCGGESDPGGPSDSRPQDAHLREQPFRG